MNFDIQWHNRLSLILILAKYADDSASFFFHPAVDITPPQKIGMVKRSTAHRAYWSTRAVRIVLDAIHSVSQLNIACDTSPAISSNGELMFKFHQMYLIQPVVQSITMDC
jgi:uncharacterized lipoprotein YbaY